ncbi:MAG: AFG1/ZapE family ATPase [Thiolinea sp.]
MLLPVLQHLMNMGVMLVATSNHPDELYQGTLKRELFALYHQLLREHLQVMHLDIEQDYRTLRTWRWSMACHRYYNRCGPVQLERFPESGYRCGARSADPDHQPASGTGDTHQ